METFSVSVNIASQSNVTFTLTYEELLQRKLGQYELLTRVNPKQPVQEFQVEHTLLLFLIMTILNNIIISDQVCLHCLWTQIVADIYEPQGIAFVEASATFLSNELLPLVEKIVTDTKVKGSLKDFLIIYRKHKIIC